MDKLNTVHGMETTTQVRPPGGSPSEALSLYNKNGRSLI